MLDDVAFNLTGVAGDETPLRRLCEGVVIFGATGSGKTSGSGRFIARTLLQPNWQLGGLVLTVKPGEADEWRELIIKNGRNPDDIIVFGDGRGYYFDFFEYEQDRQERVDQFSIDNLVNILEITGNLAQQDGGAESSGDALYWKNAALDLIKNVITYARIGRGRTSIFEIDEIIKSIPQNLDIANNEKWYEKSIFKTINDTAEHIFDAGKVSDLRKRDFFRAYRYLRYYIPRLADRTRTSIEQRASVMYAAFLSGEISDLFSYNGYNISPEMTWENNKIIILDLSLLEWEKLGVIAQGIWKYMFQKATEKRNVEEFSNPVFLWSDESHYFINEHDYLFLTTARSARCITILLTQNMNNYISAVGEPKTHSLIANLQTKIFHQNSDITTNEYASKIIGKEWESFKGMSITESSGETKSNWLFDAGKGSVNEGTTSSMSTQFQHVDIMPSHEFNTLRTGGPHNNLEVEAVIYQGGHVWRKSGKNAVTVIFKQEQQA